jgi:hypothetical protein
MSSEVEKSFLSRYRLISVPVSLSGRRQVQAGLQRSGTSTVMVSREGSASAEGSVVGVLSIAVAGSFEASCSSRYSFTYVVRNDAGVLWLRSSWISHVSPVTESKVYGPVQEPLHPVGPSRYTRTFEPIGRSCIGWVSGPFRAFRASRMDL